MTGNVVQFRDYQNLKDIERLYAEFAQDCSLATSIALIPHDRETAVLLAEQDDFRARYRAAHDTAPSEYCAPVSDPA